MLHNTAETDMIVNPANLIKAVSSVGISKDPFGSLRSQAAPFV